MLVLAKTKDVRDDLSNLTYSVWKNNTKNRNKNPKKETNFDRKDIEIVPSVPSDYHVSPYVISTYRKRGFSHLVKARIQILLEKGLYQLHNPFPEDVSHIIKEVDPPSYPKSPLSPDNFSRCSFFSEEPVQLHHPFYVGEKEYLNIAHISDSHVAARMFMLEERWNANHEKVWHKSSLSGEKPGEFSNYVKQFVHILKEINADEAIDIIIHTGDIVDYNRGYSSSREENDLSQDYYFNKNWLLFYELLLGHYEKPFFSVLGNHDYRLNPYPPNPILLAKELWELFNMAPTVNLTRKEMSTIHEDPHAVLSNLIKNHLITSPQSPQWYSLVINPVLDYQVFYGKMAFLMLDWNRREDHERGTPWAARVISFRQWDLIRRWHRRVLENRKKEKVISVVAMHPSVFNPFPELGDESLYKAPKTNIFYRSILLDSYSPQEDLVDGTFRLRRTLFIRLCLGNTEYGKNKDYRIFPEKGVDVVLAGHAHRSGLFQVKGPHVYARTPHALEEGPLFCNVVSCGPIGMKNDKGGPKMVQLTPPGYHVLFVDGEGISVDVRFSDLVCIREETRRDFGEVAQGGGFQVVDAANDLPGLNPSYTWRIQNLKEGSTITRVKIVTGLKEPSVEVRSVPLGWRSRVEKSDGAAVIVCEAHDRGQGIFFADWGEIRIKVENHSVEKMGTLAVSWDMADDPSPPVCIRVPGE